MYKKYNDLIDKTDRFMRSFNKEPILNAFAEKGIDASVTSIGLAKKDAVTQTLGERTVIEAEWSDAIKARDEFARMMRREGASFERAIAKLFRTEAEKQKFGFVTRYTNEEEENTSGNDGHTTPPNDQTSQTGEHSEASEGEGSEGTEDSNQTPDTVRKARRRSTALAAIMGAQRQIAVGIGKLTQESKDRLAEYGWTETRLTAMSNMGPQFEGLCRTAEDKQVQLRTISAELERQHRSLRDWYRTVSQTARDLARLKDHLAPELQKMGATLGT